MNLFDHNIEKELELYSKYMDFVRRYLADNTNIISVGNDDYKYKVKPKNIDIEHIGKMGERYEFIYKIKPMKKEFKMECMSFVKWKIMKTRNERLRGLGIV